MKQAAQSCAILLLLATTILQPVFAAVEVLEGQYRIMALDTGFDGVILTVSPDFENNQNCLTLNKNQLKFTTSTLAAKEIKTSIFAAAASGKTIGFTLDGCDSISLGDSIPLAQGVVLQLASNKPAPSQGYRNIGQSTSNSTDVNADGSDSNNNSTHNDTSAGTDSAQSTQTGNNDQTNPTAITIDGHEFAASKPSLNNPGSFAQQDDDYNKIWIGQPIVGNGDVYIATLTLDALDIPAGKAIANAQLMWQVSGQQSAYKLVNFEIKAVLDQTTPSLGAQNLPSAQLLTTSNTIVQTQDWANADSISIWTPGNESIDITSVIQETTLHSSWVNNAKIQLVMTPVAYPAGIGFVAFNSGESGKASPIFTYTLADASDIQNTSDTSTSTDTGTVIDGNTDSNSSDTTTVSSTNTDLNNDLNNSTLDETSHPTNPDTTPTEITWVTWRESALPDVTFNRDAPENGYFAELLSNENNKTLHFNESQGRFDGRSVQFPFEVIARNIGIENISTPGQMPESNTNPYIFAGVQIHVANSDEPTSSHVVVGHRGNTSATIEGKNTVSGVSKVDDAGANILPNARADIRIVGNADRTLTVYWQVPNTSGNTAQDHWNLYRGTGLLTGSAPAFGETVYVGLITYAYLYAGVPFRGIADDFIITQGEAP